MSRITKLMKEAVCDYTHAPGDEAMMKAIVRHLYLHGYEIKERQ